MCLEMTYRLIVELVLEGINFLTPCIIITTCTSMCYIFLSVEIITHNIPMKMNIKLFNNYKTRLPVIPGYCE